MSRLDDLVIGAALAVMLAVGAGLSIRYYGHEQYDAGYEAGHAVAVAAGNAQRDIDAAIHLKTETDLREKLAKQDDEAKEKERAYEISLQVAQRRVLDGSDRLRCPTASPVQPAAATADRPAAAGAPADGPGPDVVPEAAADLLGIAADVAGLVRRYERVVERFDACRALNEVP